MTVPGEPPAFGGAMEVAELLDQIPVAIFIVDAAGRAGWANDELRRLTGWAGPSGSFADLAVLGGGPGSDRLSGRLPLTRVLAGATVTVPYVLLPAPGDGTVAVSLTARPLRAADGSIVGAVAVVHDPARREIDLRRGEAEADRCRGADPAVAASEAQEPRQGGNRTESGILFRVSHEMATPLSVILGYGELLEGCDLPAQEAEFVGRIVEGAKDLLELVDAVREAARITSQGPPGS